MRTKRAWLWLAVLSLGTALLAAGCGGGDDEAADEAGEQGQAAAEQVITINWGTEPPSLDPGLATDTTSSNILTNLMDPLVVLDDELQAKENLAQSWRLTNGGKTVTLKLRRDGKWSNGDPVTARDFEWSWKRTISPELAADYAYQFFGIQGASEYNECKKSCNALRDKVGVKATDDHTLQIQLIAPQPWFLQQLAHHSFLAVHRPTVEQHGEKWTEAANIVTNGPFKLARWEHNSRIDLVKNDQWRNADQVSLTRVNGRMISDGTTAVQAFEAGEVDATSSLPPEETPRLKDTPEYNQYEALGTYYYGVNVKNIADPKQRQAMALAVPRQTIIDNITQADQIPAQGFTPQGMPGHETINPESSFLPPAGDMERAKQLMSEVQSPKRDINLLLNDSPGHREIAVAVQAAWKDLGLNVTIRQQEWAQFLEFIGPPPDKSVDVFRLGWIADFTDAYNFLELWTCKSGNNSTNFCSQEYDRVVNRIRTGQVTDDQERFQAYNQLEEILFGENAAMPVIPIYWYTYNYLEKESIKDTFNVNALDQLDLTKVEVAG
jgi:oligopeptide transport system substrate-binding protein